MSAPIGSRTMSDKLMSFWGKEREIGGRTPSKFAATSRHENTCRCMSFAENRREDELTEPIDEKVVSVVLP